MPYTTKYTLHTDDHDADSHQENIEEMSRFRLEESCSWYDHEKDMVKYSVQHPTVLFILDGDGEEPGDVWRKWFRNGQMRVWKANVKRPAFPDHEPLP